ncbi:GNAT family N-acetyltransferase [Aquamicrobium segne]|uniref:GNAT family N-acetyltransferase n=1 Tax=Aquamicrobium segne TaxID=469547 RepID=A0ABW0GYZ5_9HYPH
MTGGVKGWLPGARTPERKSMTGRTVRLEPLEADRHGDELFEASSVPDAGTRFTWLGDDPPQSRAAFQTWLEKAQASSDPLFFAVIDQASGKVAGRQTLMRIDANHGVAEIGNIYWGPLISRKVAATEAQFLFASYIFDELGYRRYEWKCDNANEPSKHAAKRFGFRFEGLFRQHMVIKGKNRDTAWFSIIDQEWPALKIAYMKWLDPSNFDVAGQQIRRLEEFRADNQA